MNRAMEEQILEVPAIWFLPASQFMKVNGER
jgi:hypothetical protein